MNIENKITPIWKKVFDKMKAEGKLQNITKKGYYRIEHNLAMALKPIKEESYKKQKNSRYYINQIQKRTTQV